MLGTQFLFPKSLFSDKGKNMQGPMLQQEPCRQATDINLDSIDMHDLFEKQHHTLPDRKP